MLPLQGDREAGLSRHRGPYLVQRFIERASNKGMDSIAHRGPTLCYGLPGDPYYDYSVHDLAYFQPIMPSLVGMSETLWPSMHL